MELVINTATSPLTVGVVTTTERGGAGDSWCAALGGTFERRPDVLVVLKRPPNPRLRR